MPPNDATPPMPDSQLTGTAREFAEFCKREYQRRNNAGGDFDPVLFDEAVDYILRKLEVRLQETEA